MRYGSIYLITNTCTGQQYVGQTIQSVTRRWSAHKSTAKKPKFRVANAIAEYGELYFTCIELYIAFDKLELDRAEKYFIALLAPEYNMTKGGAGKPDKIITDKQRMITSKLSKARWSNAEWRANTIKAMWGNKEVRVRRINSIKNAIAKPEVYERYKKANLGRKMPKEAVDKSSKAKWKPVYCPETNTTYLSQKAAAEMLGVLTTSIANAIKNKGKVGNKFTLLRVA